MDLEHIVGSIITEGGPQPFALNTQNGKFKMGDFVEPDHAQGKLSIIQQQRFIQLIAERAGVAFAHVRLGQYYHKKNDRWVNVLQEEWSFEKAEKPRAVVPAEVAALAWDEPEAHETEILAPEPFAELEPITEPEPIAEPEPITEPEPAADGAPDFVEETPEPEAAPEESFLVEEAPQEAALLDVVIDEEPPDAAPLDVVIDEEPPEAAPQEIAMAEEEPPEEEPLDEEPPEEALVIDAVLLPDQRLMLEKAISIAVEAHSGQTDKAGQPYILHPLRMMLQMPDPTAMMAAVLHDVVEDTGWTLEALRLVGFSEAVVDAVDGLTRRSEESYEAFIDRAAEHPVARHVKLADLEDNMDIRRLDTITKKDQARLVRYQKAWRRLQDTPR